MDARLTNWAYCWRSRLATAVELVQVGDHVEVRRTLKARPGSYRAGNASHHDYSGERTAQGTTIGSAPQGIVLHDRRDADAMEAAVCALDIFHHVILKGRYVRDWPAPRILHAAREAAGEPGRRGRVGNFDASLAMAKALLGAMVDRPAVVRRERAAARAARMLELPAFHVEPEAS